MVPFDSFGTVSYSHFIVTMAISLAISKILNIKEWRNLEIWVWDRSRSLKMLPFDRPYTTFYWSAIVTIALCCEIQQLIGQKSQNFYTIPVFSAPAGGAYQNFVKMLDTHKTRVTALHVVKKL